MKTEVKKQPKATIELKVTVPQDQVKEVYEHLFKHVVENAEIKGFRKGQAPAEMVKEKTDLSKLYGEVINKLLQTFYPQALKENHIAPVANPKVEINDFDVEKDFEFTAHIATKPDVEVGDYKKALKKTYDQKNKDVKKSNEEKIKNGEPMDHAHAHLTTDEVIEAIVDATTAEISDILIEDEADRMLSRLVDQAQSLGISIEQYLKSNNKTSEDLRKDYEGFALRNLKAEFALANLIENGKYVVEDSEIDEMIKVSGDEKLQETLNTPAQRIYIKSILLKNKLLTNIIKEIEGDLHHEDAKGDNNAE